MTLEQQVALLSRRCDNLEELIDKVVQAIENGVKIDKGLRKDLDLTMMKDEL